MVVLLLVVVVAAAGKASLLLLLLLLLPLLALLSRPQPDRDKIVGEPGGAYSPHPYLQE